MIDASIAIYKRLDNLLGEGRETGHARPPGARRSKIGEREPIDHWSVLRVLWEPESGQRVLTCDFRDTHVDGIS